MILCAATVLGFTLLSLRISREAPDFGVFVGFASVTLWAFLAGMMFATLWVRPTED